MIFIISDNLSLSLKTNFVVQAFKLNSNEDFFYISRNRDSQFEEKWRNNQVDLGTSISGTFIPFLLKLVNSPKNIHDGLLRRLLRRKKPNVYLIEGFLSELSEVLGLYFNKPARSNVFLKFLRNHGSPKIFLIDEFPSIPMVNLKTLKLFGSIVYVSQDVAFNRFNFGNNIITKTLVYKLEHDAVALSDLVVACSERDRLKYLEMGARRVIFYPNIYPIRDFEPVGKESAPCICIVLHGHWGQRANSYLEETLKAISRTNKKIKVVLIGISSNHPQKNIELEHYGYIPRKVDYLKILSKSWIGINIGIHSGGTNERKYDYALAGLVVFSDSLGSRGDLIPHEYVYVDSQDLTAKLEQILEFGKELITEMGIRNRKQAMNLAEIQREKLLSEVSELIFRTRSNLDSGSNDRT